MKLSIALAIASVLVTGGIYRVNTEAQAMAEYQTGHARLVPRSDLLAFTAISWDFSGGVDPDWSMLGGGRAARGNEVVVVETAPAKYTYQMWTTPHRLGVGRYQFTVEGRPTKGGLYLGVLDATLNQWITTANYWADQDGYEKGVMTVTFSFAIPTEVRFVLSNWNPRSERSTWILSSARLITDSAPPREPPDR